MSMTLEGNGPERVPRPTPQVASSHVLDLFKLTDRVVCVTGAASGIGYAVCEAMAEAGAHVAMFYNSNSACVQKAEELAKRCGVKAKAYQVQVTDVEAVKKAVDQVVADFGKLDCFVANAGTAFSKGILEISVEDSRKTFDVNYHGVVYCAMAAGAVFKKQGFGNFIATSSMSSSIVNTPLPQGSYNASKAAVTHLCKSLAVEWRDFARVNIVSPGFHHTDMGASPGVVQEALRMTPLGRQGDVRELKGAYLYLASDASSFCTGTDLLVDGGYSLP